MGYACPVCDVPQQDGEHLANHLAFTAMLRGGDHADWLDEHAPDWKETDPATLADRVVADAEETAYEAVFEDTTDDTVHGDHGRPDVGHAHGGSGDAHGSSRNVPGGRGPAGGVDDVVREARELTREMYDSDASGDTAPPGENDADGDSEPTDEPDTESGDDELTADTDEADS